MIGSGAAYQEDEKAPDKGTEESSMIAPTHLPGEHPFFPLFSLEMATKLLFTLCRRNRMHTGKWAVDQTKACAQTSYTPAWLLSLLLY